MANPSPSERFRASFARWARRVRRRRALGVVLSGAALGLAVGIGGAAAAWQTRHGALRPFAAAGGLLGAAAGAVLAHRRRWPDTSVALYLDGRLGSKETIATALELDADEGSEPARAVVVSQAEGVLGRATPREVRPRVWRTWHAAIPIAAGAIGYLSWIPLPPLPPEAAAPPGAEQVRLADVTSLERAIALGEANARDEAQRERLKKLAEDAKKLRDKLREGVEKREALADLSKLRDGITAERLSLGAGEERQGMESALGKLGDNPDLKDAAKALGDRDMTSLDEEMERLANKLEKEDRERAQQTLEEAEKAARGAGAQGVAKALEEQRKRLEALGKKSEKLKELAKALGEGLGEEGKQALKDLSQVGDPEDLQQLAESMEKALSGLSAEERKQLAENMKRQAEASPEGAPGEGPSPEEMQDLADQLATPEGIAQLKEQLRQMAQAPPPGSGEGERQKGLEGAQEGTGGLEGQLGGQAMPLPMAGASGQNGSQGGQQGSQGGTNGGGSSGGSGKDQGGATPGHSEGGGPGSHDGQTGKVTGGDLRARAKARMNKGVPMPGMVLGRTAGRPGESANVRGEGALGVVGPDEVGAIDRSEVPEEYREQVGRYFQPK
ncbi:hypothetical protein [Chondromyces crocatus]|uniref:Uncharacterized protein n=1 Tax=Chondromyces crocatus TaxID=52 RepID=A0A0K1E9B8_CHOCO|nr:hypothetical protein [Chondromyces crocatus]AKT37476.1 uncharacterized protein CMC5_016170 [Chondromyces crocatus]